MDHLQLPVILRLQKPIPEPTLLTGNVMFVNLNNNSPYGAPDLQLNFTPAAPKPLQRFLPPLGGPVMIFLPILVQPRSRGSIRMNSDRSITIDPCYLSDAADVEVLRKAVELVRKMTDTEAMASLAGDELAPGNLDVEQYIRDNAKNPVIVSPDAGRIKVAERMQQHLGADLGADLAFVYKRRPKGSTNVAQALDVIGDVEGRLCILTDDMIDTGGTIVSAAELLMERGATEGWAMATHGVLSGPAIERLTNAPISRVVITNTLPLPPGKQMAKLEVLSIAPLIADALSAVFDDTSVSEIFGGENQG